MIGTTSELYKLIAEKHIVTQEEAKQALGQENKSLVERAARRLAASSLIYILYTRSYLYKHTIYILREDNNDLITTLSSIYNNPSIYINTNIINDNTTHISSPSLVKKKTTKETSSRPNTNRNDIMSSEKPASSVEILELIQKGEFSPANTKAKADLQFLKGLAINFGKSQTDSKEDTEKLANRD